MLNRRSIFPLIASPYFFIPTIARADRLDSLLDGLNIVENNMSMEPVGGGRTVGRSDDQVRMMSNIAGFSQSHTRSSLSTYGATTTSGYSVARFTSDYQQVCLPLSVIGDPYQTAFAGAMTLLEGPNLVGLATCTEILARQGYSGSQIIDLVWPVRPAVDYHADPNARERGIITFGGITRHGGRFQDRDVLHARSAECVLRYGHQNGSPDGSGEGAVVVSGRVELRFEFDYSDVFV